MYYKITNNNILNFSANAKAFEEIKVLCYPCLWILFIEDVYLYQFTEGKTEATEVR